MVDVKFEKFLLKQIRRESAIYYGILIALACCVIACLVMGVAAFIIYGPEAVVIMFKLVMVILILSVSCYGTRSIAQNRRKAAEEMSYVLEHLEHNASPDYTEETKETRRVVCQNLRSIMGLIISYRKSDRYHGAVVYCCFYAQYKTIEEKSGGQKHFS